jgi:hypothetical protein
MHLRPREGCQIPTLIFEKFVEGSLSKYPMKNISRTVKFLGFNLKELAVSLTDLSV